MAWLSDRMLDPAVTKEEDKLKLNTTNKLEGNRLREDIRVMRLLYRPYRKPCCRPLPLTFFLIREIKALFFLELIGSWNFYHLLLNSNVYNFSLSLSKIWKNPPKSPPPFFFFQRDDQNISLRRRKKSSKLIIDYEKSSKPLFTLPHSSRPSKLIFLPRNVTTILTNWQQVHVHSNVLVIYKNFQNRYTAYTLYTRSSRKRIRT